MERSAHVYLQSSRKFVIFFFLLLQYGDDDYDNMGDDDYDDYCKDIGHYKKPRGRGWCLVLALPSDLCVLLPR